MAIQTMYITNNITTAQIADACGVDMIFVDLEQMGKEERQPGLDTVKSKHTFDDISNVKKVLKNAKLLARINPLYSGSQQEIDSCIEHGADIIMLPMFETAQDAQVFVDMVAGRAKTMLLAETVAAEQNIESIAQVAGIDSVHIGLNDMHLARGMAFMYELLTDGTVVHMCQTLAKYGKAYGFGGISRLDKSERIPARQVLASHYGLGSSQIILARSFCDEREITDVRELKMIFETGMRDLRAYEQELSTKSADFFVENQQLIAMKVEEIVKNRR